ncbi:MAG: porin [Gammaproteobacteria bacterium]|jgi:predicted porin
MKKQVLAIAIAGAMALPAAAMADAAVYGKIHTSIDYQNSNTDATGTNSKSGLGLVSNSSRFGIKGSHDLGNGLKAIFQVENGFSEQSGDGKLSNRNTFIGLSGGFGTALIGRHDTPMKSLGRKTDLFGDQVGDTRNTMSLKLNGSSGFDIRPAQVLAYVSPKFGGFQVVGAYIFDAGTKNASGYSLLGQYGMGPLYVGLAYESHGKGMYTGGTKAETAVRLGATYKIAAFKVVGYYENASNLGGVENFTSNGEKASANAYGLGGQYTFMGNNHVKVQYNVVDPKGSKNNGSQAAVGFQHDFTKQVSAYVDYAQMTNDDNATFVPWGGGHGGELSGVQPVAAGQNPSALSAGMWVKF